MNIVMNKAVRLVPLLLLPIPAAAQQPQAAPKPVTAIELQSLQTVLTGAVYARHATAANGSAQAAEGSVHDAAFARIRDAEFAADGKLVAFLVEAPATAKVADSSVRTLAAAAVRWDATTRRWLTASPTLQWAELPVREPTKDADEGGADDPARRAVRSTRLASELLRCVPDVSSARSHKLVEASAGKDAGTARDAKDAKDAAAGPRVVWWFAAAPQQLAVAVLPLQGTNAVVPWSALRIDGPAAAPRLQVQTSANLGMAPKCTRADEIPDHALRLRTYEYFGVKPPSWDRAPEEPATKKAQDGDGGGRGKG